MDRWDLTILYNGLGDQKFLEDFKQLEVTVEKYCALAEEVAELSAPQLVRKYIDLSVKLNTLVSKLAIYCNLCYSANTKDVECASMLGRIMSLVSGTAGPAAILSKAIAKEDIDNLINENPELSEYEYYLKNIKRDNKYVLSDGEEAVFAKLDMSGASAWSDLHSSLTSSLRVKLDGAETTLSEVRNMAYSPDPVLRKKAYEAELASYDTVKDAVAFALNSIKLQVISECELRGFESPLAKSLYNSRMQRKTLDALISAIEEYLPVFHKYLSAKAVALGHKSGLPWYDLFAPMGKMEKEFTTEGARDYLLDIFSRFDSEMHDLIKCAFDNNWIDFYPRENKVGGAFDCGIPTACESRVLTNFDGSFSSVLTLAHELGHSFHDRMVSSHSIINQEYTMPVAETASTFNEVLVMESAIAGAKDKAEQIALLESELMETCQIICDIYSRFKFEASVFEHRPTEFMDADRLCGLMLDAQELGYGCGLDKDVRHPYMWLCKGHYYSGGLSFYNYPYAFGGLFARGLYAKYKAEGAGFVAVYKEMLRKTSLCDVEDAAKIAGVDLTSPDFWRAGLAGIAEKIEQYCNLIN